jgi:hypothetical protein
MTQSGLDLLSLMIGATIAIFGAIIVEWIKRRWQKKDQKEYANKVLYVLCDEIEEGITRAQYYIELLGRDKVSLSRINTATWDSVNSRFSESIDSLEIMLLLYKIYSKFELINFNIDRGNPVSGASFAKEYIDEIKVRV